MKPLQCGYVGLNGFFGTLSGKEETFKAELDAALKHSKKNLVFCVHHLCCVDIHTLEVVSPSPSPLKTLTAVKCSGVTCRNGGFQQ